MRTKKKRNIKKFIYYVEHQEIDYNHYKEKVTD